MGTADESPSVFPVHGYVFQWFVQKHVPQFQHSKMDSTAYLSTSYVFDQETLFEIANKNFLAILWTPHSMMVDVVYGRACSDIRCRPLYTAIYRFCQKTTLVSN